MKLQDNLPFRFTDKVAVNKVSVPEVDAVESDLDPL
jgi:hypothetical protein